MSHNEKKRRLLRKNKQFIEGILGYFPNYFITYLYGIIT